MRKVFAVCLIVLVSITIVSADDVEVIGDSVSSISEPSVKKENKKDTSITEPLKKVYQAINGDPMALIGGGIAMNYEIMFIPKHAVFLEGSYAFPEKLRSYGAGVHYRHHFFLKKRHAGLNSPFWGIYGKYLKGKSIAMNNDDRKIEYPYKYKIKAFGANIGTRFVIGKRFNIAGRIGCGYPIKTFTWIKGKPSETYNFYETIIDISSIVDSELTIGIVF